MSFYIKRKLGGIYMPKNKRLTRSKKIKSVVKPKRIILPLNMHIGKPAQLAVSVGQRVKIGTLVGTKDGLISANIHSSVSGHVEVIEERVIGDRQTTVVVIKNDFKEDHEQAPFSNDVVESIRNSGIVGMGGAGFPTDVKFLIKENQKIKTLIINAAECEPFVTADTRIIIAHLNELIRGIKRLQKLLKIRHCVIAVEESSEEVVQMLQEKVDNRRIFLKILPSFYPQGAEKVIIKSVLGKEIPAGKLPIDLNTVIINVSTLLAVTRALKKNQPLYERVVTVSGTPIKEPHNLRVRIGTPIEDLIEACGGFVETPMKVLNGGPMMGKLVQTLGEPITKTTSLILALNQKEALVSKEQNCIRCSECVNACPVSLQPVSISNAYRSNNLEELRRLGVLNCIDCGACSYICPSKINLLEDIRAAKLELIKGEQS